MVHDTATPSPWSPPNPGMPWSSAEPERPVLLATVPVA